MDKKIVKKAKTSITGSNMFDIEIGVTVINNPSARKLIMEHFIIMWFFMISFDFIRIINVSKIGASQIDKYSIFNKN